MSGADPLIDALVDIVGSAHVIVDPELRASYETDWTGRFHGAARAVVRPRDATQVAAVLATCAAAGAAVVPQGGNTGLVGGSVPRGGEVVISLRRLDEISVDADQGEVVVGAGATLQAVEEAVRRDGWDVGVDLSSRGSCTIGGMVATNAGGEHVLRYGAMLEQVIAVEAAIADGTLVGRVPGLRKDNTGYHWEGLLAGSEGTLAVITRVHLRLVPQLPEHVVALLALDDLAGALTVCSRLRRALDSLTALEVGFADGIDLVAAHLGIPEPFTPSAPVVVLAECAQRGGDPDDLVGSLGRLVDGASEVRASAVATDERARARFWSYREGHAEAINAAGIPHKLDVTLPFDRLVEFESAVRARVAAVAPGARVILFGHVGDGNLHVNVLGPPPDDAAVDDAVLDLVTEMGGSIERGARHRHREARGVRAQQPARRDRGDVRAQTRARPTRHPQSGRDLPELGSAVKSVDHWQARLDQLCERHRWLSFAVAVQRRFGAERGANLAAAISMRAFVSLFPVLVLAIAFVGFVGGDPRQVADDIVRELGLSGSAAKTITEGVKTAQDTKVASSIIGIVGLLWAGTGLAASLTATWNQTWRIAGGGVRGRALGFVWLLGGLVLFALALFLLALVGAQGALPEIGVVGGVIVNTLGFLWTAWVLPSRRIPFRAMLPAAFVGGICLEVLKVVGTFVIPRIVSRSSELYGAIGAVFALLVWFLVIGRVVVYVTLIEHVSWLRKGGQSGATEPAAR